MNLPDWFCERCERIVPLPDEADADVPQHCPHCRKPTVIWLTPERWQARQNSQQQHYPPAPVRTDQAEHSVTPATVATTKLNAAEWFAKMRAANAAAPDL